MVKKFVRRRGGRRMVRRRAPMRRMRLGRRVPVVHRFKELCIHDQQIYAAAGTAGRGTLKFHVNECPNWPSMRGLFDLYKLTAVKVRIVPYFSEGDVADVNVNSQAGTVPTLYIAPNRDYLVPDPTGFADVMNDDGCRIIQVRRPITLYLKAPKPDIYSVPNGALPGQQVPMQFGVSSKFQPWLSTGGNNQTWDQSAVNHFGFRWAMSNPGGADVNLNVYVEYFISCKEQD